MERAHPHTQVRQLRCRLEVVQRRVGCPLPADLRQTRVDTRGSADIDLGPFEKVRFAGAYGDYRHTEELKGSNTFAVLSALVSRPK